EKGRWRDKGRVWRLPPGVAATRETPRGEAQNPPLIELFNRSYDRILKEGFSFHEAQPPLVRAGERKRRGRQRRRTGHNLLLRLSTRKEDVLRFLIDADVPFTNNQAERDARMMKVK